MLNTIGRIHIQNEITNNLGLLGMLNTIGRILSQYRDITEVLFARYVKYDW